MSRALAVLGVLVATAATPAQEVQEGATAHAAGAEVAVREAEPLPPRPELTAGEERIARRLEGRLKCPVCRSQSIRQSRSFMAEDMKRRIRVLLADGRSEDEIVDFFTARYGPWILLTPPKRGFNLTAYLLPFLVVGAGAVLVTLAARRWSLRTRGAAPFEAPPPSPTLERLERELEETE